MNPNMSRFYTLDAEQEKRLEELLVRGPHTTWTIL